MSSNSRANNQPSGTKQSESNFSQRFVGVHLSGPNANKTAVVILEGALPGLPLLVHKVYEKIGIFGNIFSDDRLFEIISTQPMSKLSAVFVDCPLTVPPCVACSRPVCPGAYSCEDLAVAYMLSLSSRVKSRGAQRTRPVNPQSQRLWDIVYFAENTGARREPSYSANMAPLVTRAKTLERRLRGLCPPVAVRETSIPLALDRIGQITAYAGDAAEEYRNFEKGAQTRQRIVKELMAAGFLDDCLTPDLQKSIAATVEVFSAFIAAVVNAMADSGRTDTRPQHYLASEGWVHLPKIPEQREN